MVSNNKAVAAVVASWLLAASSVNAESIVKEERDQLTNSDAVDVDPGASRGPDKPIIAQERMQLGNSPNPNVPERSLEGGQSIPDEEKEGIEK
jgi:hypothetical protein